MGSFLRGFGPMALVMVLVGFLLLKEPDFGALVVILWNRLPRRILPAALLVAAAIFAWGLYLATYHAGVEMKLWAGPTACTGTGGEISFSDLANINATHLHQSAVRWFLLKTELREFNDFTIVCGHKSCRAK